jgi:chitinase
VLLAGATCLEEAGYAAISSGDIAVGGGLVLPTVAVNDVRRLETAGRIAFTVTLSEPSATPVTVTVATVDGTATAPSDYRSKSTTVTIAPGDLTAKARIRQVDDAVPEPDESFSVSLSNPIGATIADGTGVATIRDNDGV